MDNPHVGAVLVHQGRIIGEGYHQQAGQAHAEVNCLASVRPADRPLIPASTLYVSLEPCCIKGRTPACTGLILKEQIRKVVFAQRDTTDEVSGRGAGILREAGIRVKEYPDFGPTYLTNQQRRIFTTQQRPFIQLKFAQSADGFLRPKDRKADYWITNPLSRRLVHRWRTQTNAILVGARTVTDDNPRLDARLFPGPSPRPVVLDLRGRLTGKEKLFRSGGVRPLVFTAKGSGSKLKADVVELKDKDLGKKNFRRILQRLQELRYGHITVEGGATILQAFLDQGLWDEARVFTGTVRFGEGVMAPRVPGPANQRTTVGTDVLETFTNPAAGRT